MAIALAEDATRTTWENEEIAAGMEQLRAEQRAWRLAEMRRLDWVRT